MNYICEDNINFYDLIKDSDSDSNSNINNENKNLEKCLISNLPLDITSITLQCNHKFNYYYIYNDILNQKKNHNPYGNEKLSTDTILCPYCRKRTSYLLPPVLDIKNIKSVYMVNSPKMLCLKLKCNIDNYNKEDILCEIEPCKDDLCYVTPYGNFCLMHYKIIKYSIKRKERIKNKIIKNNNTDYPIPDLIRYERKFKLQELKDICNKNNIQDSGSKKEIIIRLYNKNYNFSNK